MNLLTSKMKTSRKDYVSENLKMFFPCNEGSGDIITDIVGGVVIADTASIEYAEPHAASVITAIDSSLSGGSFPSIGESQSCILFTVEKLVTISAFQAVIFGNSAGARIALTSSSVASLEDDLGNTVSITRSSGVSAGETHIQALAFDRANALITKYDAVDTASVAKNGASASAAGVVGAITPSNEATLSTTAAQHYYAVGLYVYEGALPAQAVIEAELDYIYSRVLAGHKITSSIL